MRINPTGEFGPCRWGTRRDNAFNIRTHSVIDYFQNHMAEYRRQLLAGQSLEMCNQCYEMEVHGKVSGRQRQLLKTGILVDNFVPTLQSSPFLETFRHSHNHDGSTDLLPVDWQIDLGNYCNSACVMCNPRYSSRISVEFQKIGLIDNASRWNTAWTDDPVLVDKFCDDLVRGPTPTYLHFLGGETLIIPAFRQMLQRLHQANMRSPTIGFTTNLTVWPDAVIDLLLGFDKLHIGLSIESLHPVNQYVRWPGNQDAILSNLAKWIDLAKEHDHLIQLRLTPSALTILHVADLYQFAWDRNIGVETCNFITDPGCLSLKVLPSDLRAIAIERLKAFLSQKNLQPNQVINTRNPTTVNQQVLQDAQSYINFLADSEEDHASARSLVIYLKQLEKSRGNRVLDYLPEYEKFLTSHGY